MIKQSNGLTVYSQKKNKEITNNSTEFNNFTESKPPLDPTPRLKRPIGDNIYFGLYQDPEDLKIKFGEYESLLNQKSVLKIKNKLGGYIYW